MNSAVSPEHDCHLRYRPAELSRARGSHRYFANLYEQVVIPPAVVYELSNAKTSSAVQTIMRAMPAWLKIEVAAVCDPELRSLGEGEQQPSLLHNPLRPICYYAMIRMPGKLRENVEYA